MNIDEDELYTNVLYADGQEECFDIDLAQALFSHRGQYFDIAKKNSDEFTWAELLDLTPEEGKSFGRGHAREMSSIVDSRAIRILPLNASRDIRVSRLHI